MVSAVLSRTLLLASACTLLCHCAANSPKSQQDKLDLELPENWKARDDGSLEIKKAVADSDWVSSFGNRQLVSLVNEAVENNFDLDAAAARIRLAEANARIAGADLYPQLDLNLSGSRSQRSFIGFPFGGGGSSRSGGSTASSASQPQETVLTSLSNDFGLSLDITWEADIWGRVRAGQSAAIANVEASRADFAATELSVAAQTTKIWLALIEARQLNALAKRTLEVFKNTERIIRDQFELGVANDQSDAAAQLRLAMVDVANAEEAVAQSQDLIEQTARQLEILLGRYPAAEVSAPAGLPGMPKTPPSGVPASLLERRPDIRAAERRVAEADRRALQAKLGRLPRLSLTGSYGTSSEDFSELLNTDFTVWRLAGQAAQPIFQAGALLQNQRAREAETETALASYRQTALSAFGEVENALSADKYFAAREQALIAASDNAREAYSEAEEAYVGGVGDILTLLNAQQRAVQAERSLISVRRLRLENRVDLHLALGGDFKARDTETVIYSK